MKNFSVEEIRLLICLVEEKLGTELDSRTCDEHRVLIGELADELLKNSDYGDGRD